MPSFVGAEQSRGALAHDRERERGGGTCIMGRGWGWCRSVINLWRGVWCVHVILLRLTGAENQLRMRFLANALVCTYKPHLFVSHTVSVCK